MSAGPQWMPLNVGDYLRDTHYLTVVEHGAYLLLIMHYWQDGGLPNDEKMIMRLAHLTAEQWSESRSVLVALFDEGWKHKRIEAELAKAGEIIDKRRSAAEQRHSKSSAHAVQVESKSSYAGVPPSPTPLVIEPHASVLDAEGARVLFDELWEVFPRNPTSSEAKAEAAFTAAKAADRPLILAAAHRYRRWFTEDNAARKRTEDAGSKFVSYLSKWIEDGAWRDAATLTIKSDEASAPTIPMVKLDREKDRDLWLACEAVMQRKAPTDGFEWSFRQEVVDKARAALPRAAA